MARVRTSRPRAARPADAIALGSPAIVVVDADREAVVDLLAELLLDDLEPEDRTSEREFGRIVPPSPSESGDAR